MRLITVTDDAQTRQREPRLDVMDDVCVGSDEIDEATCADDGGG